MRYGYGLAIFYLATQHLSANYLLLTPNPANAQQLQCWFADIPEVAQALPMQNVAELQLRTSRDGRQWTEATATPGKDKKILQIPRQAGHLGQAFIKMGVVRRGNQTATLIQLAAGIAQKTGGITSSGDVQLLASRIQGKLVFQVRYQGKPIADSECQLAIYHKPTSHQWKAARLDKNGASAGQLQPGMYVARLIYPEQSAGEYQGLAYKQIRHYLTLTYNLVD